MSCATTRTRSRARRTLPSSRVATPSFAAIARSPSWRCLNGITEVREITSRARIFDSCAMTSSVIPSAKYSFSGSALRFRNGSTATDRGLGRTTPDVARASANAPAEANRSAGTPASVQLALAERLLRAHVLGGPHDEPRLGQSLACGGADREGDTEVRDHGLAFVEQDVLRFDVPMDHPLVVRVAER